MTVERIGVVGAGTMGAGIAQLGCLAGCETALFDPIPEALAAGEQRIREALAKGAERGRWTADDAEAAAERLLPVAELAGLAGCEVVIEAAPEDLELKRTLLAELAEVCGPGTILASNTSSLSVTAIAAPVPEPQRVVGMHFFNPPALMRLVEVVRGDQTGAESAEIVTELSRRMGRTPVSAADEIGFIANRCARPYGLEALRLLGERVASHEQIDRICRIGGGFRMGPFELMDLVGVDVNFEVAKSFWEQSFHEPRWQPHPIQQRMVDSGRLGRKAGRGYYDYGEEPYRPEDPEPAAAAGSGEGEQAADTVEGQGFSAVSVHDGSLLAKGARETVVGFAALPSLPDSRLVELCRSRLTTDAAAAAAEQHFRAAGKQVEWVADSPGLVLGRILAQLVNEACFAGDRGVGSASDIDTAMRLGFNYPRGPLEWGAAIGWDRVLATLEALHRELGEERYRAASGLRMLASSPSA